jgi:fumarate reductase flavoprotein subunit
MKERLPTKWDCETEVAVIGAGAAGPAVAISAHSAGAKVLILERMLEPSGDMALSAGMVYAADTSIQKALGIEDSSDRMYKLYIVACPKAKGKEAEKMRMIADGSAEVIEWLISLGVKFPAVIGVPGLMYGGLELLPEYAALVPPTPGAHACEGGGKALQAALIKVVKERGIQFLTETRARELIANAQGEIIGIKAENKGKALYIKTKRSVVICCGHFSHNKDLIERYVPEYVNFPTFTAPGLEGDGILMAQMHGAAVANISDFRVNIGMPYEPGRALLVVRWCPCILVNKKGKRFINDHAGYGPLAKAITEQEDSVCFVIFDNNARKTGAGNLLQPPLSGDLGLEIKQELVKTASTIRELAKEIGVDLATFEATVSAYNENARLGKDPEFGSTHFVEPILNPPFYAIKCVPAIGSPTGGLETNLQAQVLNVLGKPIPRLYAVGTVASLYPGYPGSGSHMASIFVFGRIAGRNAAEEPLSSKNR